MEPKKVIAVFFILALLAVAIGVGAMCYLSQQPPDGHYNYDVIEKTDHYESKSTVMPVVYASDDRIFYKTQITLINDKFDAGLQTKLIQWKMTVDDYSVNQNDLVFRNVDFKDVTVQKGEKIQYTVIFEIPKNILGNKISVGYVYVSLSENPKLSYDSNLKLTTTQISTDCIVRCYV